MSFIQRPLRIPKLGHSIVCRQSIKSVAGTYTIISTEAFGEVTRGTMMLGADVRFRREA